MYFDCRIKCNDVLLNTITQCIHPSPGIDRTVELQSANPNNANNNSSSTNINDTSATQFSTERLAEFYAFANGGEYM